MSDERLDADASDPLRDRLLEWVGKPLGTSGPSIAPDPVNVPMIRHWVDALDDRNPIYLDPEAAERAGHGGIVAPPAMLQTWTMGRPGIEGIAERGGAPDDIDPTSPIVVLADAGFPGTLATNSELEFDRYLRPGDQLRSEAILESISEKKTTALGAGYFVTWVTPYEDASGARVGHQRFRIFKFAPGTTAERRSDRGRDEGRNGSSGDGRAKASGPGAAGAGAAAGEVLPPFELPVTATVIVAGAIASRDFMPVHHDRAYAQAQGAPDVFMNILTTNGYVARFVTDWAGPEARLRRIAIRLGAPAIPGLALRFSGRVTGEESIGDERRLEVAVRAENDLGAHATGTVELTLPAS